MLRCDWPVISPSAVYVWPACEAAGWALAHILHQSANCFANELWCSWTPHNAVPLSPCCARWWSVLWNRMLESPSVCNVSTWVRVVSFSVWIHYDDGKLELLGLSVVSGFTAQNHKISTFEVNFDNSPKIATADGSESPQQRGEQF